MSFHFLFQELGVTAWYHYTTIWFKNAGLITVFFHCIFFIIFRDKCPLWSWDWKRMVHTNSLIVRRTTIEVNKIASVCYKKHPIQFFSRIKIRIFRKLLTRIFKENFLGRILYWMSYRYATEPVTKKSGFSLRELPVLLKGFRKLRYVHAFLYRTVQSVPYLKRLFTKGSFQL